VSQPLTHAEAREALEALFTAPAADAVSGDDRARLAAHLDECSDCAAEHAALTATAAALHLTFGPPQALRQRVLEAVARTGRERGEPYSSATPTPSSQRSSAAAAGGRGRLVAFPRALAAAAALAVLAFIGGAVSAAYFAPRDADSALAKAAMMMAELAREPAAHTMTLRDPSGAVGGTLMYEPQSNMLVVFSEALAEPATGGYDCYVERDGQRTWIGPMLFEAETAFWAGPIRTDVQPEAGDLFVVLADESDATPMLVATF
jgi:hypothetical protein